MRSWNTLKEIAVSAISAANSPYDTIYITVGAYAYGNLYASMGNFEQVAMYKRRRGIEAGTTWNKSSRDLISGPQDLESAAQPLGPRAVFK